MTFMGDEKMIIDNESLIELAKTKGVALYKAKRIDVRNGIELDVPIEEFVEFAAKKAEEIFYCYDYVDKSQILITGDTIDEASGMNAKLIENLELSINLDWLVDQRIDKRKITAEDMEEYSDLDCAICDAILESNNVIDKSILKRPVRLVLCIDRCVNGCGSPILWSESDDWSTEEYLSPQEKLGEILGNYERIADKNEKTNRERIEEIKGRIEEYLLHDDRFWARTTKSLRLKYAQDMWTNDSFQWVHEGFKGRDFDIGGVPTEFVEFINMTYTYLRSVRKEMKK